MTAPVTLLMAVHAHQPVGNFGFVFEEAYAKAYDPFLRVLERHPGVRLALHYSGCLLDWLLEHRPEFIRRVRTLVAKGQVELLASGYYEPILPLIPEEDRQGQVARMREALRKYFGTETTGLWLTERVWEPELPATLARAGIRYTIVDTNQFALAKPWLPSHLQVQDDAFWDLLGSYTTDYTGSRVRLFPASRRLRYWMPFQSVDRTMEFLRRIRRQTPAAVTFADDAEKFGLWPKTYHWVYDEGWLDQFFSALEREREWLTTTTFRDYAQTTATDGVVHLPCGSYEEMLEWSGGAFRNYFIKYPEANTMQQKMLAVSAQLRALEGSPQPTPSARWLQQARTALYRAQCNCAYWHGVFGGLYLTHLRRAVYANLITAEQLADQAAATGRGRHRPIRRTPSRTILDADGDGREEIRLKTEAIGLLVDPADGGSVTEWSLYGPKLNLLDTLTRRPEPYHEKLKTKQSQPAASGGKGIASIHDLLGVKEEHLESHLVYDDHRRSTFLDCGLQSLPGLQEVVRSTWGERRLWSAGPCRVEHPSASRGAAGPLGVTMIRDVPGGRIRKSVRLAVDRPVVEYLYELEGREAPVVGLEFNIALCDERYRQPEQVTEISRLDIRELAAKVSLSVVIEPSATLIRFPVETVSESEEGLERTYQGLCLVLLWATGGRHGRAAKRWACRVAWTVRSR